MTTINIDKDVGYWGVSAEWLRAKLPTDKDEEVLIKLNTPGGDVFEGFKIYQLLEEYSNVTIELGAIVASAGTYMILSAKKIIAKETSSMMIHKAWDFAWGNSDEMQKSVDILKGIDTMIAKVYAKKLKSTQKKMLQAMKDETWLFGGEAILEFGLADEIVKSEEPTDIDENVIKAMVDSTFSNSRNKMYKVKMGDVPPENKNVSNSIKKEEPELSKDKNQQTDADQPTKAPTITEDDVKAAIQTERSRMNQILNVSGLKVTSEVAKALNEGQSYPDFCVALAESKKEVAAPAKEQPNEVPASNIAAIGAISNAPAASETVPTDSKNDKIEAAAKAQLRLLKDGE